MKIKNINHAVKDFSIESSIERVYAIKDINSGISIISGTSMGTGTGISRS